MPIAQLRVMRRLSATRHEWLLGVFAVGILLSASRAQAEESERPRAGHVPSAQWSTPGSPATEETSRWYGSLGLGLDAGALALVPLGIVEQNFSLCLVGAGVYAIGGPIIHLSHGHPVKALGSFVLRLGISALAGMIGYEVGVATWTDDHTSDSGNDRMSRGVGGFLMGVIAGGVAGALVDDLFVAREPVRNERSVNVVLVPNAGGASLALAGRF